MIEILQFLADHGGLAFACFLLACIVLAILSAAVAAVMSFPARVVRHLNIRAAGWPPAHCDGDGDAVEATDATT
jgi:hypothetical protein